MKQTNLAHAFNDEIARELEAIRDAAAQGGLRVLQDLELDWVGGGDGTPLFDGPTP